MKQKRISKIFVFGIAILIFLSFFILKSVPHKANADTNISAVPSLHWAWNDLVGWIDHYSTLTVYITGTKMKGYASSTAGDISFDCATSRTGPTLCNTSAFKILNDGSGNLNGWAWNDIYGWISFCGGQNTSNCPGSIAYSVHLNMNTGIFSGYAWNDVIGWISYNCADWGPCSIPYEVVAGAATSTSGYVDSTPYDTGVSGGAEINSVSWKGTLPSGTSVYFQISASNVSTGPWSFVGPDGTANTYYGPVSVNTSYQLNYVLHNDKRYFKYRIYLYTDSYQFVSPRIDEININWSP